MIVKFLEKEYSIPEDVLTYIDLLSFTDGVQKQLFGTFVRKLKNEIAKDNIGLLGDEDLATEIEQQIGRFIAKLCDNGIFTRTISDYLKNNKGYQLISQVNKAALEKMKSLLIREMDEWQSGYENAVSNAESHVTGMGFSIWSSSFVNHAIYAAMEASKLKEQSKEAEAQYQKDMSDLRSRLDSQYGGEKSNYINNTYIPSMESALTVFAYELLDKYVADLIANGKFDSKTLDYVDIGRSNDLLKNLTLSNNKQAILENAFAACPYNIAVYMQAMKYGLLDYDSFQTAKAFKQNDTIISFLKDNWGNVSFPTKFHIDYHCVELLALFTNTNQRDLLHTYTERYATGVVKAYSRAVDFLNRKETAVKVMRECSNSSLMSGSAISKSKASTYVMGIVSEHVWEELTQRCGHANLLDTIKHSVGESDAITKRELDIALEEKLYHLFEEIRQELSNQIIEANRLKAEEEKARAAELSKMKEKRKVAIIVGVPVAIIAIILLTMLSNKMELKQQEREAQQRIEQYCTFQLTVQTYSSEKACLSALQKLSSEYSDLQKIIRDDWNSYGSEEEIHEALMLELDKNFASVAEEIVSNCSVELEHSAAALIDAFDKHGWRIEYIGEKIAERDYAYAFDNYMDISGKYVEDATYYIINTLYPETFSKGIRERLLHVGVHAWGNTGRELLNSILSYIDSMPEGRTPFESDIATARRQLSEKNAKTGK